MHILALEALLSVINIVENHCNTVNEAGILLIRRLLLVAVIKFVLDR